MDGEGIITIKGHVTEVDVFIEIIDNGLGMQEETASLLLTETTRIRRRGTGVGLINVNQRIQLRFGEKYGLKIESEPDVGTKVIIHLPKILYADLNEEEIKNEK